MFEFLNCFAVATTVTFPNSLFTQHPLVMFTVRPPRTYRGKECATRLVHTSVRIPVGSNQGRASIRKPVSQTTARGGGIKVVRELSLLSNRTQPSVVAARSSACHTSPVQTIPVSSLPVNPFTTRPCRAQHAQRHCAKDGGRSS